MLPDDLSNDSQEQLRHRKDTNRNQARRGLGGDGNHPGSGDDSIHLGTPSDSHGDAAGYESVAIGHDARAVNVTDATSGEEVAIGTDSTADGFGTVSVGGRSYAQHEAATALGWLAFAGHTRSTAIGRQSVTTATDQIMLGRSSDTVVVPGTFSNPSARRLKQNIIPAPRLVSIFPELVEYEYIADEYARRHLGHIADGLVGTDAERFVQFDDDGNVAAIAVIEMLMAQVAVLNARVAVLEKNSRGDERG